MNFLFRGGPQTVEKGREEEKGVRIPALAVQPTSGRSIRDSIAEHGVQLCNRFA